MSQALSFDVRAFGGFFAEDGAPPIDSTATEKPADASRFFELCSRLAGLAAARQGPHQHLPDLLADLARAHPGAPFPPSLQTAARPRSLRFLLLPHLELQDFALHQGFALPRPAAFLHRVVRGHLVPVAAMPVLPRLLELPYLRAFGPPPPPAEDELRAFHGYLLLLGWCRCRTELLAQRDALRLRAEELKGKLGTAALIAETRSGEAEETSARLADCRTLAERTAIEEQLRRAREAAAHAREKSTQFSTQLGPLVESVGRLDALLSPQQASRDVETLLQSAGGDERSGSPPREGGERAGGDPELVGLREFSSLFDASLLVRLSAIEGAPVERERSRGWWTPTRRLCAAGLASVGLLAGATWLAFPRGDRGAVETNFERIQRWSRSATEGSWGDPLGHLEADQRETALRTGYETLQKAHPDDHILAGRIRVDAGMSDGSVARGEFDAIYVTRELATRWKREYRCVRITLPDTDTTAPDVRLDESYAYAWLPPGRLPSTAFRIEIWGQRMGDGLLEPALFAYFDRRAGSGHEVAYVARGPGAGRDRSSVETLTARPLSVELHTIARATGPALGAVAGAVSLDVAPDYFKYYSDYRVEIPEIGYRWLTRPPAEGSRDRTQYFPEDVWRPYGTLEFWGTPRRGGPERRILRRAIRLFFKKGEEPRFGFSSDRLVFVARNAPGGYEFVVASGTYESPSPDYAVIEGVAGGYEIYYPMKETHIGRIKLRAGAYAICRLDGDREETLKSGEDPSIPEPAPAPPGASADSASAPPVALDASLLPVLRRAISLLLQEIPDRR
ncbi:MAG: hypothetical protein HYZ53_08535 [Planctomycetes bacterium]|nr:hypothetical protein [Planctomycetota bacterium]